MLQQAIDRHLRSRPQPEREIGCFHPSDLHRKVVTLASLYLEGEDSTHVPARTLRIFDNGLSVQERLVGYFKEMGILIDLDVEAENEDLEIKGIADAVVEIAGHERVVEIKSINKKRFSGLTKPKRPHLIQLNTYMYCLGINQGIAVYENKDSQELREFNVGLDPAIVAEFTRKIKQAQHLIRRIKVEDCASTMADPYRPPEKPKQAPVPHVIQLPWEAPGNNRRGILGWFWRYLKGEEVNHVYR